MDINSERTGSVFIENFDLGVVETLGPSIGQYTDTDGRLKTGYILDVPRVGSDIPIVMDQAEAMYENYALPSVIIRRDDQSPALNRWPSMAYAYKKQIELTAGKRRVEFRPIAYPFDLMYTIEVLARLRAQANYLLEYVLRVYKPYGRVFVVDTIDQRRSYEAFMESTAPLDELVDSSERMAGFAITLRIEGELTLDGADNLPGASAVDPIQVNLTKQ